MNKPPIALVIEFGWRNLTFLTGILDSVYLRFAKNVQRVHLSIEESPASWVVKLFGEVGGGVPEYFSSGEFFSVKDAVKVIMRKQF